jgi:hypothetical protein
LKTFLKKPSFPSLRAIVKSKTCAMVAFFASGSRQTQASAQEQQRGSGEGYEGAPHTTQSSKEHERLGVTFDARLFIFLEGAEARPILAIDELFDALVLPRAALEKRELIALGRTIAQGGFEVGNQ